MQKLPRLVLLLAAADGELALFESDLNLLVRKSGQRQGDAQLFGLGARRRDALDIVRRIAVRRRLRHLVERALDLVEAEQKGRAQRRHTHHGSPLKALHERRAFIGSARPRVAFWFRSAVQNATPDRLPRGM